MDILQERTSILRSFGSVSALIILATFLAFARELVLASGFGADNKMDGYLVALTVPFLVSSTIVSTFEAVFIPLYANAKQQGEHHAEKMANTLHLLLLICGFVLFIAVALFQDAIIFWQVPGFSDEMKGQIKILSVYIIPSVIFSCLYAFGRGYLNAEKHFLPPVIASAGSAVVMIICILLLKPFCGIQSVALGYTLGTLCAWLIVFIPVIKYIKNRRPVEFLSPFSKDILLFIKGVIPILLGVLAMSLTVFVDRQMASRFPEGAISALSYADKMIQMPIAVIAAGVATVIFPNLSDYAASHNNERLKRTFSFGVYVATILLMPIAMVFILLNREIIILVFQRGQFTSEHVATTSVALVGLSIGLAFMGLFQLVPRLFNALHLPLYVGLSGILNLVFKIIFNGLFVNSYGYLGISLATSAMYLTTGVIMLGLLSQRIRGIFKKEDIFNLLKILICVVIMALTIEIPQWGRAAINPLVLGVIGLFVYFGLVLIINRSYLKSFLKQQNYSGKN